ncbi:sigma-70 family RNA polymerase sigma factor [Gemmata sp. G18]|uniref:Sigma-70 family RNA polymerase sigma factor n=1 Tax=Gemmata palustris TaxID=2822762 RepID=A0ABS5BSG0_9BACT|nr:sigma-70 family RNA polymerase sigma factor [Gemmata palustris]MBP3956352.1 sigma-70 family RNA polymerase sigma factor [Gemmata palustris]
MADMHAIARLAALAHSELADHALLARFATERDEFAFAALVERHGPVVLDVARSVLRHTQDAEDVFQASFLVLARNANTIRTRASIGCWLHGVARRIALRALRSRTRRARHEAVPRDTPVPDDELTWAEVRALIHAELAGLPEALRAPILLCHLEGLTLDEAATRLELPRGTLRDRLDRGRERLRQRLARRGLAAAAIAFSASSSNATPPLMVLVTARSAVRFAAGFAEPSRAVELANGAVAAMTPTRLKFGLLFAVTFGAVGLVVAGIRDVEAPAVEPPVAEAAPVIDEPEAAAREVVRADLPVAPPPVPAPRVEFESITVVIIKPPGLSNEPGGTIRISSDGSCLYEVPGRVPPGGGNPLPGARLVHKLPRDRLRALNQVLKDTEWLKADAKEVPRLHAAEYTITLERNTGRVPIKRTLKITGVSEGYRNVFHFFQSIAHQEFLLYRLEWLLNTMVEARRDLDNIIGGELGESIGKSLYAIDLTRFVPWATRTVRNSFNKQVDEVRVAVRLIGLLKLEAEREHVNDLATDRDSSVRAAVALAVGRLGGEKAVPVLRKMLRSTSEAPWELIKLGPIAVPTIVDVIQNGGDPSDMGYEHLIRAYIENWKDVPQPLDGRITVAVMAGAVAAKEKAVRTQYHEELLKLIATPPPPEDPKLARARADVLNLANAVEAYRAK